MARFSITTVGCAKNEVDSDAMRARLLAAGLEEADEAALADVCLVNTCSFLAEATRESVETTLEIAGVGDMGEDGRDGAPLVVMCGCVPSRYGAEVEAEIPEVAAFVAAEREDEIAEVVLDLLGIESAPSGPTDHRAPLRTAPGTSYAFLKIAEGCDRHCAFCAIPSIRGPYVSRPFDEILAEARSLTAAGARELVLVAQDTSRWGHDLPAGSEGPANLAELLWSLGGALPEGTWIRVLYVQPEGLTDELIDAFARAPGVLPYIDMPIQHASARVLASMGRRGDAASIAALIARIRRAVPQVVLRTTAMAGFPGETAEEAAELIDFLFEQRFDYVSVFAFSAEEGTRAATMDSQVDEAEKLRRTQALVDCSEALGFASCARRVGEEAEVLVDGPDSDGGPRDQVGHAWFQAPDTDGVVHLGPAGAEVGSWVRARLVDAWCYELEGEVRADGEVPA